MKPNELLIPAVVTTDPKARELLRVWAAHGKQYVVVIADIWSDPAAWGLALVDLAKHIASAYSATTDKDYASALKRILEGFFTEWSSPTDAPSGGLVDK